MRFILVHTGNEFPKYINDCIIQLLKYNLNIDLIISKNIKKYIRKEKNIKIIDAEEYENDLYRSFKINHPDASYRDGFWQRTSSRFFLISNYVEKNNISNFFHIENDVLIYSNFIKENEILLKSKKEASIVIDSNERCVPSIMWFKDYKSCQILSDFIYKNPSNNDMRNIFLFYLKNNNIVANFPILPDGSEDALRQSSIIKFDNLFKEYNSIFDAAAIGQYLGGIDTRPRDEDTRGYVSPDCIFDVKRFNFEWTNNEPYMLHNQNKIKINNLHIHSKNLYKFI